MARGKPGEWMNRYEIYIWLSSQSQGFDRRGMQEASNGASAIRLYMITHRIRHAAQAQAFLVGEYAGVAAEARNVSVKLSEESGA